MMNAFQLWLARVGARRAVTAERLVVVLSVLACLATTPAGEPGPGQDACYIRDSSDQLSFELADGAQISQSFRIESPGEANGWIRLSIVGDDGAQVWGMVDSIDAGVWPDAGRQADSAAADSTAADSTAADGAGDAGTFDGGERDAEAEDIDVVIDPDDMPDGSVRVDPQMLSERSLGFAITPGSSTFDLTLVHSGSGNVTVTVTADVEMLVACESSENMVESSETTTIDAL